MIICLVAASVGLSMVIISISKLLLVLCGLVVLLSAKKTPQACTTLRGKWTPVAVLLVISAFALSLLWTVAPVDDALGSLAKYGKLLIIVLLMYLIRSRRDAMLALQCFMGAQLFLLASSWMLFAHLPVPWATSKMALMHYTVFSSYLDQGIMSAVFAAMCWHLRVMAPGRWGKYVAVLIALLALGNVFFVLSGRSGHVVAIALMSLVMMWELPKKYRPVVMLLPFALALVLSFTSVKVRERLLLVQTEVQSYSTQRQTTTSSGTRLHFWHRALQMMAEHPLTGSGVGSWSTQYNRLERASNPAHQAIDGNGNPHQEYLLWGMQLGIPGLLLIALLMISLLKDSMKMNQAQARAAQSALLALAIACLFNASLYDALIGDFFCVLMGLLLACGSTPALIQQQEPNA